MRTVSVSFDYFLRTIKTLEAVMKAWGRGQDYRLDERLYYEAADILDRANRVIEDFRMQERGELPVLEFEHEGFHGYVLHNGTGVSWAGRFYPIEDATPELRKKIDAAIRRYLKTMIRGGYHV